MRDLKGNLFLTSSAALILWIFIPFQAIFAQAGVFTSDVQYNFAESILFSGNYSGDEQVISGTLFFQIEGEEGIRQGELRIQPGNQVEFQYNLADDPIRAFSTIKYWFELDLDNGQTFSSPHETLQYEDNRFDWQERETEKFHLR